MGEIQGQRYICKICSKSCVSGKSLGGHMRVHLALISASKKAAQEKAEIKMEFEGVDDDDQDGSCQLKESSKNRSDSDNLIEEKIMDFGDGDQNNNYELRENPKKSWRISNPKHGLIPSKNLSSCKECGKGFPSLRALSGHMRSHSVKNQKVHQCKECGKGFDSMRAMFGHMKSHSKKSRIPDNSADSLSDLDNLCPVRRKRSRIRYKNTPNPSLSSLNESTSTVAEHEEVEDIAKCLMMLSRGVRDWVKTESVTESSDDSSVYFGAESSACRSKKFARDDGDFVCDVDKKMVMSVESGKLDCCFLGSVNAFTEKNVSEFDVLDSRFAEEHEMKVEFGVSDDELLSVENERKVDLEVSEKLNAFTVKLDSADNLAKVSCENEANDHEILRDFVRKHEIKCRTRDKIFDSQCMLEGHKMQGNNSSEVDTKTSLLSVTEAGSKFDHLECGNNQLEKENSGAGIVSLESCKSKEYECPICFKVFHSGQALGGHKRAHYTERKTKEAMMAVNEEAAEVHDLFDLNFPVTVDEGAKNDEFDLWWPERRHEHEALVLTN